MKKEDEILARLEDLERELERQKAVVAVFPSPEELAIKVVDKIKTPIKNYVDSQLIKYSGTPKILNPHTRKPFGGN